MSPNSGDLIGQTLAAFGVEHLFTLCGGHIPPILAGAKRHGLQVVDVRHEATAVFAAEAVGRLSGLPGVATVTAGPGVTNSLTALKNAQMSQSPLVLLSGAAPSILHGRGALQDIDQVALVKSAVKLAATVIRTCDIVPVLTKAFETALAQTRSGPTRHPMDRRSRKAGADRRQPGPVRTAGTPGTGPGRGAARPSGLFDRHGPRSDGRRPSAADAPPALGSASAGRPGRPGRYALRFPPGLRAQHRCRNPTDRHQPQRFGSQTQPPARSGHGGRLRPGSDRHCRRGRPVLINAWIGRSGFREGSISI